MSLALLEGLCSALAWMRYHTLDVAQLIELETHNDFLTESWRRREIIRRYRRHAPMARHHSQGCRATARRQRLQQVYNLLTGGSVAQLMWNCHYLESELGGRLGKDVVIGQPLPVAEPPVDPIVDVLLKHEFPDGQSRSTGRTVKS